MTGDRTPGREMGRIPITYVEPFQHLPLVTVAELRLERINLQALPAPSTPLAGKVPTIGMATTTRLHCAFSDILYFSQIYI